MTISGRHLIAGQWLGETKQGFVAFNALENKAMTNRFADATEQEVEQAINAGQNAFKSYHQLSADQRAKFLRAIGTEIEALGEELISTASAETGLPAMRIQGERGRTVGQLNLFASLLEQGEYQGVIDLADPSRSPLPKPDTRLGYLPLGVVAVFGASNFPLAFSTAGGDTASALAAGCPVIMKAHTAHPATAELIAQAILKAILSCDIDPGVFALIQGENHAISSQIVTHPLIKGVGFTGSERVGMILQQQINQRPEPIPFYGELGSINPQFIMPHKLTHDAKTIANELVASLMMGQGQFCTSPGVWLLPDNAQYQDFAAAAAQAVAQTEAGVMLTPAIAQAYKDGVASWQSTAGVELLASGQAGATHLCQAALFSTDFATFAANPALQTELFGSAALIVKCADVNEMLQAISVIKGNLTASIHALPDDLDDAKIIANNLVHKVGRLIYNQMPTGVEVCASMNHGGPFPASTNIRSTSVGSEAIKRWQRPICYQNMPSELLPTLLQG
ncbi:NADP-dependent aldehyde dehydrogenase [Colwellia chukchiensis]|uniref:NADP-dependent aldehyde dehydrogenase n=1 Tax=Colwellia chukchiensis TaxID=641665 RepID=A0A1H7J7M6_9GAMM|nr:aldehyde dehydrogenase (NADP(+)) [Colwellia chukchiensis]SEK70698.1 NADP-dependent aldehyde dehydrogenase [Colwellia chukchiensis]